MSVAGGPRLVTNGLILNLDACHPNSQGSGTSVWRDLSDNNQTVNAINSPTWSAKYVSLNGTNQYFQLPTFNAGGGKGCTMNFLLRCLNTPNGDGIFSRSDSTYYGLQFVGGTTGQFFLGRNGNIGYNDEIYDTNSVDNNWFYCTAIIDIDKSGKESMLYINGIRISGDNVPYSNNDNTDNNPTSININLGSIAWNGVALNASYLNADFSTISVYNRVLSPEEIKQNYYSFRARFNY